MSAEVNIETAKKLWQYLETNGLSSGLGEQTPGRMCVEAAVCYVMGLPHGDDPQCVAQAVRSYKIRLNDALWSSDEARAAGLKRVAVAQLGSRGVVNDIEFRGRIVEKTIRVILPEALRAAARVQKNAEDRSALEQVAQGCAAEGSRKMAILAMDTARRVARGYSYWSAAAAAADAADAAAAAAVAADARLAARDRILIMGADICLEVLRELNSPGVGLLDQIESQAA